MNGTGMGTSTNSSLPDVHGAKPSDGRWQPDRYGGQPRGIAGTAFTELWDAITDRSRGHSILRFPVLT